MLKTNLKNTRPRVSGFSIIELAIVLAIVSTLLGGLLFSLSEIQESNNRTDSANTVDEIVQALYGFAQINGRLPCPATPASFGAESPPNGGACDWDYGFVPWSTLGLNGPINTDSLLVDNWLNPYRYNVTDVGGDAFTRAGGLRGVALATLPTALRVCSTPGCGANTVLADSAPAVIVSLGANWATFTSADEVANSGERTRNGYRLANNDDFVSVPYNELIFDDMITWLSPNVLYTKMVAAGQLP